MCWVETRERRSAGLDAGEPLRQEQGPPRAGASLWLMAGLASARATSQEHLLVEHALKILTAEQEAALTAAPSQFPACGRPAQIVLPLWKPGFFQRACWWEVSGHRRVGRDGDRTMARADSPMAATGPAEASPGCLVLKLSFGTNLGYWAHCFRASAAQTQSQGLPEDPKSGLAVALKGSAGCTGSEALREEACLLTRHGYNRKKWYVST